MSAQAWGKAVVTELANFLAVRFPNAGGLSDKNLWRMKQFYETYKDELKLSALPREINWTNHLLILSKTRSLGERQFYLELCKREKYSSRELERQLNSSYFERVILANEKLLPLVSELPQDVVGTFKELQVGNHDYYIDLLFYNRTLNCLVAVELKVVEFEPEFLGKLNFYLEAFDRDVRKPHENPSIGILLCRGKDNEVVEYALSRSLSPTVVADYQTKMPDKQLLQAKLHELFARETDR